MSGGEDRPDLHHTPDTGLQLHRVSALQCCSTQGNRGAAAFLSMIRGWIVSKVSEMYGREI